MPCTGTKPSCRAAVASRQPATSTAPSRSERGLARVPVGERQQRMARCAPRGSRRARAASAAAARSASARTLGSRPVRVAWKNARYGCCVGCAKCRGKRLTRIAVPPFATGNASRHSRSASPSPRNAAPSGFGRSRGRYGVSRGTPITIASSGASSSAAQLDRAQQRLGMRDGRRPAERGRHRQLGAAATAARRAVALPAARGRRGGAASARFARAPAGSYG